MHECIEVEVNGETFRITPDIAQKYGEKVAPSPLDYQKKALVPVSDKEWAEFSSGANPVNGMPVSTFSAMVRPILDAFMRYRCQSLK